ncbi:MAG: aminoacyl-tRNA hydrolase [Oscillospiraceae bacterium]|nr:aminoacyl-tRNA hydrolase [Oscillospiraceae bacterium]MCI9394566.1 aminoacyl-tRNA hydrolase [Oscillospiraceae bacterium]
MFGSSGGAGWLIVGLGNPGVAYENTRHNIGFQVLDQLGERQKKPIQRLKFKALTNLFTISGEKVLVMKPVTYMNLSGEAVRPAADFYKIPPERILVVSDDTALPAGRLRIRKGGSAGGHNGLKSIIQHLGSDQFPRLRVGVGEKPHPDYDMADWVLGKFTGEDKKKMDQAVERAAEAIECILKDGLDRGMSRFNGQS